MIKNNNFFIINDYYIYIYPLNEDYKYTFLYNNNNYYLYIKNKSTKNENIKFNIDYYKNNLFNNLDSEISSQEQLTNFLKYNWYYFGSKNKLQYFKYVIYKHEHIINKINYTKLTYNKYKK